jgi:hypothetical protein
MLGSHIAGGPLLTVFPGLGPWAGLWAAGPPPIVIHVSRCTPRLHLAGIFGRASVSSMWDLVRFLRISPVNGIPVLLGVLSFLPLARASPDEVPSIPSPLAHRRTQGVAHGPLGGLFVSDSGPWTLSALLPHQRQCPVPFSESFANRYPPLLPRFCSSFLDCLNPGAVTQTDRPVRSFPATTAAAEQALWTGMIYTNQLMFLAA